MRKINVEADKAGMRADVFVASQYPEFTRSALEVLFDTSCVTINGNLPKTSYKLRLGDKISVDDHMLKQEPGDIDLPIVYEDDNVVVINKPSGVLTHSKGTLNLEATVASFIHSKINDKELVGNRAGIVHRLDRGTSGIIIVAKNSATMTKLQKQFAQRKTKKIYLAIVEGEPKPEQAVIDAPIARNPKKPQTFRVSPEGKSAQTQYSVLKSFVKKDKRYSLLELKPLTGRTHQLRVHLAYIGHPIVGDHVYGSDGARLMLHATSLEITIPTSQRKVFEAAMPQDIKDFISV